MNILLIGVILIILISLSLKFLNTSYNRRISRIENTRKQKHVDLLDSTGVYEQFKKVSKESLVRNGEVRSYGDFMDFFIMSMSDSNENIENQLLRINHGEKCE